MNFWIKNTNSETLLSGEERLTRHSGKVHIYSNKFSNLADTPQKINFSRFKAADRTAEDPLIIWCPFSTILGSCRETKRSPMEIWRTVLTDILFIAFQCPFHCPSFRLPFAWRHFLVNSSEYLSLCPLTHGQGHIVWLVFRLCHREIS